MSRSLNRLKSPALTPCYWITSSDGLVTYPEWRTTACLRWSCMANSPLAIVTEGHLRKATKTASRRFSMCHIDCQQWSDMTADRDAWRPTVHKAASQFEENRRDSLKDKPQKRKAQAASTTENPDLTNMCRHCTRRHVPVSHRPPQPWTGLQSAWTTTFPIFVCEAKPNIGKKI